MNKKEMVEKIWRDLGYKERKKARKRAKELMKEAGEPEMFADTSINPIIWEKKYDALVEMEVIKDEN